VNVNYDDHTRDLFGLSWNFPTKAERDARRHHENVEQALDAALEYIKVLEDSLGKWRGERKWGA
jgi:hypothetical protein